MKYDVNNAMQQFAGKDTKRDEAAPPDISIDRVDYIDTNRLVQRISTCLKLQTGLLSDFSGKPQFI